MQYRHFAIQLNQSAPQRGLGRYPLDEAESSRSWQQQSTLQLEIGRRKKRLKLVLGPLATAEYDQHVHVHHRPSLMAGRSIYLRPLYGR